MMYFWDKNMKVSMNQILSHMHFESSGRNYHTQNIFKENIQLQAIHHIEAMSALCNLPKNRIETSGKRNISTGETVINPLALNPDSKIHGANMGPTWVLSAPDGPHVGPMHLAIRVVRCDGDFKTMIFKRTKQQNNLGYLLWNSCQVNAKNIANEKSTLFQAKVWCVMQQAIT